MASCYVYTSKLIAVSSEFVLSSFYAVGKAGRRVLLLEKKKFPREKYCGDAVCKTAIEILHEMGIYKKLIAENKARVVRCHIIQLVSEYFIDC